MVSNAQFGSFTTLVIFEEKRTIDTKTKSVVENTSNFQSFDYFQFCFACIWFYDNPTTISVL